MGLDGINVPLGETGLLELLIKLGLAVYESTWLRKNLGGKTCS